MSDNYIWNITTSGIMEVKKYYINNSTVPRFTTVVSQPSSSLLNIKSIYPPQLQILSYEGVSSSAIYLNPPADQEYSNGPSITTNFNFSLSVCVPKNYLNQYGGVLNSLINNNSYLPTITFNIPDIGDFVFRLSNGTIEWVNPVAKASVSNNRLLFGVGYNDDYKFNPYRVHTYATSDKYLKSDIVSTNYLDTIF